MFYSFIFIFMRRMGKGPGAAADMIQRIDRDRARREARSNPVSFEVGRTKGIQLIQDAIRAAETIEAATGTPTEIIADNGKATYPLSPSQRAAAEKVPSFEK